MGPGLFQLAVRKRVDIAARFRQFY